MTDRIARTHPLATLGRRDHGFLDGTLVNENRCERRLDETRCQREDIDGD